MPIYSMQAPNGKIYDIEGPEGATEDQVREQILALDPKAGEAPTVASPAPKDEPSKPGDLGRAFRIGTRNVLEGAGGLVDLVGAPVNTGIEMLTGVDMSNQPGRDLGGYVSDQLGLEKPETDSEKLIGKGVEYGTQGLMTAGAGNLLKGAQGTTGMIASALAETPVRDVATGVAAGLAEEGTRQAGYGEVASILAGVGSGVGSYAALSALPKAASMAGKGLQEIKDFFSAKGYNISDEEAIRAYEYYASGGKEASIINNPEPEAPAPLDINDPAVQATAKQFSIPEDRIPKALTERDFQNQVRVTQAEMANQPPVTSADMQTQTELPLEGGEAQLGLNLAPEAAPVKDRGNRGLDGKFLRKEQQYEMDLPEGTREPVQRELDFDVPAPKAVEAPKVEPIAKTPKNVQEVVDHTNELASTWKNAPEVEVHPHFDEIEGADPSALGVYDPETGKVLLNATGIEREAAHRGISTQEMTNTVMFHEGLGHYGLAQKFRGDLDAELTKWYENSAWFKNKVNKWIQANSDAYADENQIARAGEEILAELSEKGQMPTKLLDNIKNQVKQYAREMGIKLDFSAREIRTILAQSHEAVVNGMKHDVRGNGYRSMRPTAANDDDIRLSDRPSQPDPTAGDEEWFKFYENTAKHYEGRARQMRQQGNERRAQRYEKYAADERRHGARRNPDNTNKDKANAAFFRETADMYDQKFKDWMKRGNVENANLMKAEAERYRALAASSAEQGLNRPRSMMSKFTGDGKPSVGDINRSLREQFDVLPDEEAVLNHGGYRTRVEAIMDSGDGGRLDRAFRITRNGVNKAEGILSFNWELGQWTPSKVTTLDGAPVPKSEARNARAVARELTETALPKIDYEGFRKAREKAFRDDKGNPRYMKSTYGESEGSVQGRAGRANQEGDPSVIHKVRSNRQIDDILENADIAKTKETWGEWQSDADRIKMTTEVARKLATGAEPAELIAAEKHAAKLANSISDLTHKAANQTLSPKEEALLAQHIRHLDDTAQAINDIVANAARLMNARKMEIATDETVVARLLRNMTPAQRKALTTEAGRKAFSRKIARTEKLEKALGVWNNIMGFTRSLWSSYDLSAPFRQGRALAHHTEFWKNMPNMFKYWGNEGFYDMTMEGIKNRPSYGTMKRAGLAFTELGKDMSKREEAFMSTWAEKIPGVKASERAYNGYLNKLRADIFDKMHSKLDDAGVDMDDPKVLKDLAHFINNASGRGNLDLGKFAPTAAGVLFSPRLMASRMQMLNPMYYAKLSPGVRAQAVKSAAAFAASSAMFAALLSKVPGVDVEADPRSSDFMKIKVGDTRYDMLGGFGQYVTLYSRLFMNEKKNAKGDIVELGKRFGSKDALGVVTDFVRNKFSPNMALLVDARLGENAVGEEFDPKNETIKRFFPLVVQDFYKQAEAEGAFEQGIMRTDPVKAAKGAIKASPSIIGIGSNTYPGPTGTDVYGRSYEGEREDTPAISEMKRLEEALGKSPINPPKKKIGDRELTEEEYNEYQKLAGEWTTLDVENEMQTEEWAQLSDEEKLELIREIASDQRANARAELFGE